MRSFLGHLFIVLKRATEFKKEFLLHSVGEAGLKSRMRGRFPSRTFPLPPPLPPAGEGIPFVRLKSPFFGLLLLVVLFSGCKEEVKPTPQVDNSVTRYTDGLVTATEKAKDSVDKANEAIAASQSAMDQMAMEIQ
ncbi:MAG: hypothetical protein JNK54_01495 [Elusimicrobia bacterium]|jgi:hypothetical protein|nr:hypothetical protein [Elusimicrobiota bacterium]